MAAVCRERANREPNEQLRDDLLTIAERWLFLAHSYECLERLGGVSHRKPTTPIYPDGLGCWLDWTNANPDYA